MHRPRLPDLARAIAAMILVVSIHPGQAVAAGQTATSPPRIVQDVPPQPSTDIRTWAVTDAVTWTQASTTIPQPSPPPVTQPPRPRPVVPASTSGGSHRGYGSARECVADTENGGDYGRSSNPSHFGRYQFSRSAWISFGGDPGTWGTASPDEQDAVFDNAWSQGPAVQEQQWLRWDGC